MKNGTPQKESGFAKFLARSLSEDPQARVLFLSELMNAPIASQLRLLRHFRGLSQVELSRKVKLAQPEFARLEKKGANPRADTLEKIAKGLGARVELIPETLIPFIAARQLRAHGEAYFLRVALAGPALPHA